VGPAGAGSLTRPVCPALQERPVPTGTVGAGTLFSNAIDDEDRAQIYTVLMRHLHNDTAGDLAEGPEWGNYARIVAPGDLTEDGAPDVVALDQYGRLYLHVGVKGFREPKLAPRAQVGTGWGIYDRLVSGGDHTGDGRPDLLARDYRDGKLYVYRGTGSAKAPFAPRALIGAGWNAYLHLASPGDLTGDGRADLVAVDSPGNVYRYTATGRTGGALLAPRSKIGTGWKSLDKVS
jgi:hypothetical protein